MGESVKKHKDFFLNKVVLLSLKIGSTGTKFLFFSAFLPKEMLVSDYGDLNLLITTVTFFLFFIGFDFYTFSHRDFINENKGRVSKKIYNHFVLSICLFLVSIPILYLVLKLNNLSFFVLAASLLYSEYLSQEIYRLLILFSKPILANAILFFRSSIWIILLIILSRSINVGFTIENILLFWILGNLILLCLTSFICFKYLKGRGIFKINLTWIKKGLLISAPFLLSTLSLKIIELSDRYIINYFFSNAEVGVYSFYSNIANTLNVFVNTSVVITIYPKLLESYKSQNEEKIKYYKKVYKREMIIFLFFFATLIGSLFTSILNWLGKDEFIQNTPTFWILLSANILFNLSLIPHHILYASYKDKEAIVPIVIAGVLNVIFNLCLVPIIGIMGAGISTLISFMLILILKYNAMKKLTK